jgi:hypothetical protein
VIPRVRKGGSKVIGLRKRRREVKQEGEEGVESVEEF